MTTSTASPNKQDADDDLVPLYKFWQPRFWLLWLALGLLRLLILLPFKVQLFVARMLGALLQVVARKRYRIARINIDLCFPELSAKERQRMAKQHMASLAFSMFEISMSIWSRQQRIEKMVTFEGLEYLSAAMEGGQGVVIVSGHFPAIELTGRVVKETFPQMSGMYRPLKNPLLDQLARRARRTALASVIPKDDIRQMIRLLRKGRAIWYASDQSYNRNNSELVAFFGVPAMTNAALTNLARVGKAKVVPMMSRRLPDGNGYYATFMPALENFPTEDAAADALLINKLLEDWIREAPEQYYWVHRRFKNRPAPHPDPYTSL